MKHRSHPIVRIHSHLSLIALWLSIPFAASAAQPAIFEIDAGHSYIGFVARHLMVAKVKGQFPELTGRILLDDHSPDHSAITVSVSAASVDSNNDKRDRDIRGESFLAVEQFPSLAFRSTSVERRGGITRVTGDLTIRGVTRRVVVPFQLTGPLAAPGGRQRLGASAAFTIDRRDYGIVAVPEAIVGNDVVIEIEIEAHASPAAGLTQIQE